MRTGRILLPSLRIKLLLIMPYKDRRIELHFEPDPPTSEYGLTVCELLDMSEDEVSKLPTQELEAKLYEATREWAFERVSYSWEYIEDKDT